MYQHFFPLMALSRYRRALDVEQSVILGYALFYLAGF